MPEHETAAPPRPLAITQGDVAGIGPEIVAKVFRDDPGLTQGCFVVGSLDAMRRAARWVAKPGAVATPVALIRAPQEAVGVPPRCIPVLQLPGMDGELPAAGHVDARAGRWAGGAVEWAARAALASSQASTT